MPLGFRRYDAPDRQACLAIFRSNIPTFFAPAEEADFTAFLAREVAETDYFVVEDEGALLGCGGVYLRKGFGGMVWGMVTRTQHRRGVGRFLLLKRLEHLYRHYPELRGVRLDTSQHSQGFFARFGFEVDRVTADGYAPGLDRYDMTLPREALAHLLTGTGATRTPRV